MRLLLDSHVLVWWLESDRRLSIKTRGVIADASVFISLASCWELGAQQARGRLDIQVDLFDAAEAQGFTILTVENDDVRAATALPLHHLDPFDRMLIAQAGRRELVLLTADAFIFAYDGAFMRA